MLGYQTLELFLSHKPNEGQPSMHTEKSGRPPASFSPFRFRYWYIISISMIRNISAVQSGSTKNVIHYPPLNAPNDTSISLQLAAAMTPLSTWFRDSSLYTLKTQVIVQLPRESNFLCNYSYQVQTHIGQGFTQMLGVCCR